MVNVAKENAETNRGGLTLLELLVVLMILTVLAVLAVRTTESIVEQNRYEASQRGLEELREAVLGPAGFVAHTGRLPRVTNELDGLGELMDPAAGPALGLVAAPSDSDILVATGRAAPYLRTRIGDRRFRDGWGNPYLLRRNDDTLAATAEPIAQVWSAGANYPTLSVSDAGYDTDLTDLRFVRTVGLAVDEISASIVGTVYELDAMGNLQVPSPPVGGSVVVRYYGPADGSVVEVVATPNTAGGFTLAGTAVTIGPRTVRAYLLDAGGVVIKRSPPVRLTLHRGPNTVPSLVLR